MSEESGESSQSSTSTVIDAKENFEYKSINRVAVKIPPFWPTNPLVWFRQVEAQFNLAGITQDATKFYTLLTSIETNILGQVHDAIIDPPRNAMYQNLKDKIIERYSMSEQRKINIC